MSKADTLVSKGLLDLAAAIELWTEKLTGKRLGFCLMVFSDEKHGTSSYISNTDRKLTAAALRELLDRWEEGMADIPAHVKH